MYYVEDRGNELLIHEYSGTPHFTVWFNGDVTNYNLSGNILSISYTNGNVEVYDVDLRSRIR